jgi:dihydroorotase
VDIRVQLREPGEEHKGTLASAGRAATAGGITSMVCLPNTQPVIDDMSVVEFVARRARLLELTKVYPYAAVTKGLEGRELAEMGMLAEAGAVAFTDGVKAVGSARVMRQALQYARTFDLLIVEHPEEPTLASGGDMNAGEVATRLGLVGIPREAEVILVERDIHLVRMTGGRLHFAHLSTAAAIDAVRQAKLRGLPITCDTAPPYFAMNENAVGDYRTFAKLSPPLRAEEDRLAVIEGLLDGTIDAIASDHAPEDEDAKRLPFAQAAFGGIGLDTLLSVSLDLYHNGHCPLLDVLRLLTCRPAELMGLPAGRLLRGARADLVLFDPDRAWQVREHELYSKSKNTPFDYRPVLGRALLTVVDGRRVFALGG